MREQLAEIAERVMHAERERRALAESLRKRDGALYEEALERGLVLPVEDRPASCTIAAVDGGLLAQEFHGFDLLLSRALAVIYTYENGRKTGHQYHPSAFPQSEFDAESGLDLKEFAWHQSLFRLKQELAVAAETVVKFRPNFLLLDGSIVPQIADKPSADSGLRALYDEVISLYKFLYAACEENGCGLVGIIKDSRGKRFIEIISRAVDDGAKHVLTRASDTAFLSHLLSEGERTFEFPYSMKPEGNAVLKDLGGWAEKVHAFYIKPVADDRPLRVEFMAGASAKAGDVASLVADLSAINRRYAYPAILIEADMRAAMNAIEMERMYRQLFARTGGPQSAFRLRRDDRPFR